MNKRGVSHRSQEGWLSLLPDSLLCQILSNLPTKISVRTSTLSTRWKNLYLSIPVLDLDIDDFPDYITFTTFVSHFLDFSCLLHKLKLSFKNQDTDHLSPFTSWIETAVTRKIQHLDVDCRMSSICEKMPLSLYLCGTLVSLELYFVSLQSFEVVFLPNLRLMHLEENVYADGAVLEKLISSCPVLEDLTIVRNVDDEAVKTLRVRSQTLKRLRLVLDSSKSWFIDDSDDWEVVTDAPRVTHLSLKVDQSVSFAISQLSSSATVEVDVSFNVDDVSDLNDSLERISGVGKLLNGLSGVRDMTISGTTLKIMCQYLKHESMPQFRSMTRFKAKFDISDLELLPDFLESCPNLQSLVLKVKGVTNDKEEISFSSVLKCLQSSLEHVEMTCGNGVEMKLVKYLLENSVVLKKFTLRLKCPGKEQESIFVRELMRFQRCSSPFEVNIVTLKDNVMYFSTPLVVA